MGHEDSRSRKGHDGDDAIVELLNRVGPRPTVPDERSERVRSVVRNHWERRVRSRSRRKTWIYGGALAAAATVIVAITVTVWPPDRSTPTTGNVVATVEAVTGTVTFAGDAGPMTLAVGDTLTDGMTVLTDADGRIALRLASGPAVRVAHGTRLSVRDESVVELDHGTVYIDSGTTPGAETPVEVLTFAGAVHDIGTQFEVHSAGESLRIRVREGQVLLETAEETHYAEPGDELRFHSGGTVTRHAVSPYGPEWSWTQEIAPLFALEGRTLGEFLDWVSRESGRNVLYDVDGAEATLENITLHGSIEGLSPDDAVAAVLPTCGLSHTMDEGTLVVRAPGGSTRAN